MPEICRRKRKNAIGGCSKGVCWVRISSSDAEIVTLMRPKTGILLLFCCALCFANWRSSPSLCLGVGTFCVNEPNPTTSSRASAFCYFAISEVCMEKQPRSSFGMVFLSAIHQDLVYDRQSCGFWSAGSNACLACLLLTSVFWAL